QSYELPVKLYIDNDSQINISSTINDFHSLHEQVYGQSNFSSGTEITSLRVTVRQSIAKEKVRFLNKKEKTNEKLLNYRNVYFDKFGEYAKTPVYDRSSFSIEGAKQGPLIIIEENSTTLVPPNWSVKLASNNSLV